MSPKVSPRVSQGLAKSSQGAPKRSQKSPKGHPGGPEAPKAPKGHPPRPPKSSQKRAPKTSVIFTVCIFYSHFTASPTHLAAVLCVFSIHILLHRPPALLRCGQQKRAPKTSVTFNLCISYSHFTTPPTRLATVWATKTSTEDFSDFQFVYFLFTFYCIAHPPCYGVGSENEHRRLQ